jgi:toxin ParE1/3/4
MEKKTLKIVRSKLLLEDLADIYQYGYETFGSTTADFFLDEVNHSILRLSSQYYLHPECRRVRTKSKKYRSIILGKYLIVYRIVEERIEVLRAIHGSRAPSLLRSARSIKI